MHTWMAYIRHHERINEEMQTLWQATPHELRQRLTERERKYIDHMCERTQAPGRLTKYAEEKPCTPTWRCPAPLCERYRSPTVIKWRHHLHAHACERCYKQYGRLTRVLRLHQANTHIEQDSYMPPIIRSHVESTENETPYEKVAGKKIPPQLVTLRKDTGHRAVVWMHHKRRHNSQEEALRALLPRERANPMPQIHDYDGPKTAPVDKHICPKWLLERHNIALPEIPTTDAKQGTKRKVSMFPTNIPHHLPQVEEKPRTNKKRVAKTNIDSMQKKTCKRELSNLCDGRPYVDAPRWWKQAWNRAQHRDTLRDAVRQARAAKAAFRQEQQYLTDTKMCQKGCKGATLGTAFHDIDCPMRLELHNTANGTPRVYAHNPNGVLKMAKRTRTNQPSPPIALDTLLAAHELGRTKGTPMRAGLDTNTTANTTAQRIPVRITAAWSRRPVSPVAGKRRTSTKQRKRRANYKNGQPQTPKRQHCDGVEPNSHDHSNDRQDETAPRPPHGEGPDAHPQPEPD